MNLYKFIAEVPGDGCMDRFDLYVRANGEDEALRYTVAYYEWDDPALSAEEICDSSCEDGWEIELLKTYEADAAVEAGAIGWDVVHATTIGAL